MLAPAVFGWSVALLVPAVLVLAAVLGGTVGGCFELVRRTELYLFHRRERRNPTERNPT